MSNSKDDEYNKGPLLIKIERCPISGRTEPCSEECKRDCLKKSSTNFNARRCTRNLKSEDSNEELCPLYSKSSRREYRNYDDDAIENESCRPYSSDSQQERHVSLHTDKSEDSVYATPTCHLKTKKPCKFKSCSLGRKNKHARNTPSSENSWPPHSESRDMMYRDGCESSLTKLMQPRSKKSKQCLCKGILQNKKNLGNRCSLSRHKELSEEIMNTYEPDSAPCKAKLINPGLKKDLNSEYTIEISVELAKNNKKGSKMKTERKNYLDQKTHSGNDPDRKKCLALCMKSSSNMSPVGGESLGEVAEKYRLEREDDLRGPNKYSHISEVEEGYVYYKQDPRKKTMMSCLPDEHMLSLFESVTCMGRPCERSPRHHQKQQRAMDPDEWSLDDQEVVEKRMPLHKGVKPLSSGVPSSSVEPVETDDVGSSPNRPRNNGVSPTTHWSENVEDDPDPRDNAYSSSAGSGSRMYGSQKPGCFLEICVLEKHVDGCKFRRKDDEVDKIGGYDVVSRQKVRTCIPDADKNRNPKCANCLAHEQKPEPQLEVEKEILEKVPSPVEITEVSAAKATVTPVMSAPPTESGKAVQSEVLSDTDTYIESVVSKKSEYSGEIPNFRKMPVRKTTYSRKPCCNSVRKWFRGR